MVTVLESRRLEAAAGMIRRQLSGMGLVEEVRTSAIEYTMSDVGYSCAKWLRSLDDDAGRTR